MGSGDEQCGGGNSGGRYRHAQGHNISGDAVACVSPAEKSSVADIFSVLFLVFRGDRLGHQTLSDPGHKVIHHPPSPLATTAIREDRDGTVRGAAEEDGFCIVVNRRGLVCPHVHLE